MQFDCGITGSDPWSDPRFFKAQTLAPGVLHELAVLIHTPGIPLEWLYTMFRWGATRRRRVWLELVAPVTPEYLALGKINAASVVEGDGMAMLVALDQVRRYAGPAPLWSQMELAADKRSDAAIARKLGTDRQVVRRWRTNCTFCPLTGVRVVPPRGRPIGSLSKN